MKKLFILVFIIFSIFICGCENKKEEKMGENMNLEEFNNKIKITINNQTFSATLEDNETSREFVKRLPLSISMDELNGNEKYYYFDEPLPSNPSKIDKIYLGDIMLYGSDCLVLFYETFSTTYTYTRLAKIDDSKGLREIVGNDSIEIVIDSLN